MKKRIIKITSNQITMRLRWLSGFWSIVDRAIQHALHGMDSIYYPLYFLAKLQLTQLTGIETMRNDDAVHYLENELLQSRCMLYSKSTPGDSKSSRYTCCRQ